MHIQRSTVLIATNIALLLLLAYSGWHPYDRITWIMEVLPILIAMPIMWVSYRKFPLTDLLYVCIFLHAVVLIAGGAYSYARVPLGFQIADLFHLTRNPYDKIGHLFQGFVPALVAREIFIRRECVRGKKMIAFLATCVVMMISASYELIEWGAAVALGQGADEFLGTQGDPWDTQSDMLFALIGAVLALLFFSRFHDRQIKRLSIRVRNHSAQPV